MAGATYAIRVIPFLLMRKKISNKYIIAFLEYIPYTVLTAMTIPAIFYATSSPVSAAAGFFAAVITAYKGKSLVVVAVCACLGVGICEGIMMFI